MNFCSYTSYISGNWDKALGIRLLRRFGRFLVLCKGFSSGALLHIRQKDRIPPSYLTEGQKDMIPPFISDRRTKGQRAKTVHTGKYGLRSSLLAFKTKWRKKGQNKSAQGNALGIVRNQHSPRMGKRIIISRTPFATLQWWAVILLPPSGAYPCCIQFPGRCPGLTYRCPFGA